jgi:ankyrin repeat protein
MQDSDGWPALMFASKSSMGECSSLEIVKLLVENGADIDVKMPDGTSALKVAAQTGKNEVVKLLLEHGAKDALWLAIEQTDSAAVLSILEEDDVIMHTSGFTPLVRACELGLEEIAGYLLAFGVETNMKDESGKSALVYAACNGHTDLVINLIDSSAQIDTQDSNGWSPLMHAVKAGHLETARILVMFGASPHSRDIQGRTIFDVCPQRLLSEPFFQEMVRMIALHCVADCNIAIPHLALIYIIILVNDENKQ